MRVRVSTDPTSRRRTAGPGPSVVGMARRTSYPESGRLAAVLLARPAAPASGLPDAAADDRPTVPIPRDGHLPRPRGGGRRFIDRWLPAAWRDVRIDPGRPGALAVVLVGVVAAVVAAVGVWREAPRAEPVAELPVQVTTTAATAPSTTTAIEPETLVVAVAGKVRRPGLVRVASGSRVADVLEAAGGPLPDTDLSEVNLARKVSDGEQVAIGVPPAPDAGPAPATGGSSSVSGTAGPTGPLDLNAATIEQLDALPGVGPVTAQHIVEWRTRNGRFATVDQLREVEGIGERRLGQLRELVRV
jgi:competence protein ComEA